MTPAFATLYCNSFDMLTSCSQAFETKNSLVAQKGTLGNATGGLGGLSSNVPGIGKLIDGISKKKYRETIIVALAVSVLICFTIWLVSLSLSISISFCLFSPFQFHMPGGFFFDSQLCY